MGIVTTGALHLSGAIQADRAADCKGLDRTCVRRDKTKRMVVRESIVRSQVGSRTRRKGIRRALHKFKQPIIDGVAQGNRPIVATQAQLGDVLRLNRRDVGLQRRAGVSRELRSLTVSGSTNSSPGFELCGV